MRSAAIAFAVFMSANTCLAQDYSDGVSGAEAEALVLAAMRKAGITDGTPVGSIRPFPACDVTPAVSPRGGDWNTAIVSCGQKWNRAMRTRSTYVPQRQAAEPKAEPVTGPMVVALARNMDSGEMVTAADILMVQSGSRNTREVFTDASQVIGRRLKSRAVAQQLVLMRHLEPNWLVVEGQPVVLRIQLGGFEVTAPGEALDAGQNGDIIRIKNVQSQKVIKGIVSGENTVLIGPNIG